MIRAGCRFAAFDRVADNVTFILKTDTAPQSLQQVILLRNRVDAANTPRSYNRYIIDGSVVFTKGFSITSQKNALNYLCDGIKKVFSSQAREIQMWMMGGACGYSLYDTFIPQGQDNGNGELGWEFSESLIRALPVGALVSLQTGRWGIYSSGAFMPATMTGRSANNPMPNSYYNLGFIWHVALDFINKEPFREYHDSPRKTMWFEVDYRRVKLARLLGLPHDFLISASFMEFYEKDTLSFTEQTMYKPLLRHFCDPQWDRGTDSLPFDLTGTRLVCYDDNIPTPYTVITFNELMQLGRFADNTWHRQYFNPVKDVIEVIERSSQSINFDELVEPQHQIRMYNNNRRYDVEWSYGTGDPLPKFMRRKIYDTARPNTHDYSTWLKADRDAFYSRFEEPWSSAHQFITTINDPDYMLDNKWITIELDDDDRWDIVGGNVLSGQNPDVIGIMGTQMAAAETTNQLWVETSGVPTFALYTSAGLKINYQLPNFSIPHFTQPSFVAFEYSNGGGGQSSVVQLMPRQNGVGSIKFTILNQNRINPIIQGNCGVKPTSLIYLEYTYASSEDAAQNMTAPGSIQYFGPTRMLTYNYTTPTVQHRKRYKRRRHK